MNDITKKGITQKDVRFTSSLVGDASQHRMYYTPTTIKSTGVELGGVEYSSEISREDETNATRTKYAGKELATAGRELLNSQTEILPVIVISAHRSCCRYAKSIYEFRGKEQVK